MIKPIDKLQMPSAIRKRSQSPNINNAMRMAGEQQLALDPLVGGAVVESRGQDLLIGVLTADFLIKEQVAVEREEQDMVAAAEDDVAARAADLGGLDRFLSGREQRANAVVAVEIPEEDLAVSGDGEEGAEDAAGGEDGDRCAVAEEVCLPVDFDGVAGLVHGPDC